MATKGPALYSDEQKRRARRWIFSTAIDRIKARGRAPQDLRAAILVDGTTPQALDVDELVSLGVRRENIWAISKNWDHAVRGQYYQGIQVFEGLAHEFFATTTTPSFDLAYLDFCKPLCNDGEPTNIDREFHFRTLFNLFLHDRLQPYAVLATNFNVLAYFNNPLYREFLLADVEPDFGSKGGARTISARVLSDGWMNVSDHVFSPEKDPRRDSRYQDQQVRILMAFMHGFFQDIGEVFVPAFRHRDLADLNVVSKLDDPFIQDGKPVTLGPQPITWRDACQGRIAQTLLLLEDCPENIKKDLVAVIGGFEHLWSFAFMTALTPYDLRLPVVHSIPSQAAMGNPYGSEKTLMLPVIWDVERQVEVGSDPLWGRGAVRPYRELRQSRPYEAP